MPSRRRLLQTLATGSVLSITGCASLSDRLPDEGAASNSADATTSEAPTETTKATTTAEENETTTSDGWSIDEVSIDVPTETYDDVQVQSASAPYPRMGPEDAPVATVLGNWKCPYTRDFVLDQFPALVDDYVRSGALAIEYRSLSYFRGEPFLGPDAPDATRGGLAVWETDASSFWSYFATVFANQPQERHEWAKPELLVRFAREAGVSDPDAVGRAVKRGAYEPLLEDTVAFADSVTVGTVPRVVVDGSVTAPTVNPKRTREQLERAIDR